MRPITPEEVPPNLNFYAIDPLYKPGIPLGWAKEMQDGLYRNDVTHRSMGYAHVPMTSYYLGMKPK